MFPDKFFTAGFGLLAVLALPTAASGQDRLYASCLAAAERNPTAAYEDATSWVREGGGDLARHCAAVALIHLGRHAEAAKRLEELGKTIKTDDPNTRAEAFAQAAQVWLLAGNLEKAYAAQSAGLTLSPNNLELLLDRGITATSAADYSAALVDLNQAHAMAPRRADILVHRARVHRFLNDIDAAMRDLRSAVRLAPDFQAVYLERGILRQSLGDQTGAREDWNKVLILGEHTPVAAAARINLETVDVDANARTPRLSAPRKIEPAARPAFGKYLVDDPLPY